MGRTPTAASVDDATASIWRPFSQYVQKHFDSTLVHTPERMFHYTSAEVARSIARTGELWLFNIFEAADQESRGAGSPDQREVLSGIEIMCNEVIKLFKRHQDSNFHEFADHFNMDMKTQYQNIARIYTFCMSLSPNNYLWNEAQKKGDPGCIEVSDKLVEDLCKRETSYQGNKSSGKYIPGVVVYDKEELLDRIRPFLNRAVRALAKAVKKFRPWDYEHIDCVKKHLIWDLGLALLPLAHTYKDRQFIEENEIRLLNIISYPHESIGETAYNGRSRIIETVDRATLHLLLDPPPHRSD